MKLKNSLPEGLCLIGNTKLLLFDTPNTSKILLVYWLKAAFLIVLTLLVFISSVQGQGFSPLKAGDKVPDVILSDIHRNPGIAKLSDLKGKLVILDFWATWCSACLTNFPKMENLNNTFRNKLVIMPVAYQDKRTVTAFFASENGKRYDVTSIVGDAVLKHLFPHQGLPYCVWIGPDGRVLAFTTADEITAENIAMALEGNVAKLIPTLQRDANKPLFLSSDLQGNDSLQFYSLLVKGHYNSFGSGNNLRRVGDKVVGIGITNSNLLWLYETAAINLLYQRGEDFTEKRMIVNVADTSKITLNAAGFDGQYNSYKTDNDYNYDLIVPLKQADNLYNYMLADLNRYTDYIGKLEKIPVNCLVLKRTDTIDRISSVGGKRQNTVVSGPPYKLTNLPLRYLIVDLENLEITKLPIIDATGYAGNVDMVLPAIKSIADVNKVLASYGLILKEENRAIDMFTVSDKPQHL